VGRLVATRERIVGQDEVTLASNSYNEIGQLKGTAVGRSGSETAFVNTTSYSYNERGWLSKSISPRFSQQLKYQDGTNPQWNGNISQQLWGDDATLPNTFSYSYDKLNRLLSGTNGQTGAASIAEVMSYDDMGNIKTLKRDALSTTTYTYTGNKLTSLAGGLTGSYTYDGNGNAKTDRMGMAFTYNYLNLPQTARKAGADVAFLYDATGQKLQKVSKIGTAPGIITTKRDYVAGIEYNNDVIDIIQNSVGYAQKNGTGYVYHYNLTDHLGNVRATLKRGSSATAVDVVQRDNYYPFGKRKVVAGGNNKYLYNGKEIQGELGDQYDYGARFYDAEIGRWNVVDPLAEKYFSTSNYSYVVNSPINAIDPDGKQIIFRLWYGSDEDKKYLDLTYRDGAFYFQGGLKYDSSKGSISKTLDQLGSVFADIEKSGNKELIGQLKTLETSKNKHIMSEGENKGTGKYSFVKPNVESSAKNGLSTGTKSVFNFNDKDPSYVKTPLTVFTHEMRHMYDYEIGNMKDNTNEENAKNPVEIRAIYNENIIRKIYNLPLRDAYGKEKVNPNLLKNPPNLLYKSNNKEK